MINEKKLEDYYKDVIDLRYILHQKKKLDISNVIDVTFCDVEGNVITRMDNRCIDDIALRLSQTLLEEINVEIAKYLRKYPELESNV